jgi:hypothetical protein
MADSSPFNYVKSSSAVKLTALVLILAGMFYILSSPLVSTVNDATRADLSQHVSAKSCGVEIVNDTESHSTCPGNLKCYRSIDEERVGEDISGPRCVTSTFVDRHCGLYEVGISNMTSPPAIRCSPLHLSLLDYIKKPLEEENLYDRIFNTNRNGTELIHSYGLKLAVEMEK